MGKKRQALCFHVFLNLVWMEGSSQLHAAAASSPVTPKVLYTFHSKLGIPQSRTE